MPISRALPSRARTFRVAAESRAGPCVPAECRPERSCLVRGEPERRRCSARELARRGFAQGPVGRADLREARLGGAFLGRRCAERTCEERIFGWRASMAPICPVPTCAVSKGWPRHRSMSPFVTKGRSCRRASTLERTMADEQHVTLLRRSVREWNRWRVENPRVMPDLAAAGLGVWI